LVVQYRRSFSEVKLARATILQGDILLESTQIIE